MCAKDQTVRNSAQHYALGFICSDSIEPRMILAPQSSKEALAVLLEGGFQFNEVY